MGELMLESQGVRPSDPYRTLQLHPHAPRTLIVEAYWHMVRREQQRGVSASEARLDELNAAYGLLLDDRQRRAFDEEHGLAALERPRIRISRKRLGLFGPGEATAETDTDYYHLLRIDRDADGEIIDLAHRVLTRPLGRSPEDAAVRALLDTAYRTLHNSQLRAQYDASLAQRASVPARTPPAVPVPARQSTPAAPPPPAGAPEPQPARNDVAPGPTPGVPAAATVRPDDAPAEAAQSGERAAEVIPEPYRRGPSRRDVSDPDGGVERTQPAEGVTPAPASANGTVATDGPGRGLLHRMRIRSRRSPLPHIPQKPLPVTIPPVWPSELEAARDERLLTLREGAPDPPAAQPVTGRLPHSDAAGEAALVFVAGPFTGARVALGDQALTLGSSPAADMVLPGPAGRIAPEHARIWRHGDRFVLRQLDEASTEVSGQRLSLPLVVLEDGDDIQIGPHRMRFCAAPATGR